MKLTVAFCESLYSTMVKIRRFDEKVAELFQQGIVKGTAHSYVGQEAVAGTATRSPRAPGWTA
jgi:TPP-dependent pyruvate/acetoin dehydrogenase alpha subunit